MIDYEKLKEADNLAQKAIEKGHKSIVIEYNFDYGLARTGGHCLYLGGEGHDLELCDIDEVIDKLKELTKPEPTYKMGDNVWIIASKGGLHKATIKDTEYGLYTLAGHADMIYTDKDIFPSRESLIDAQIEYWQSLKEEEESSPLLQKGTTVFYSIDNRIHNGVIDSLASDTVPNMYHVKDANGLMYLISEEDLFRTKQDLLRATMLRERNPEFDAAVEEAFYASNELEQCKHEPYPPYFNRNNDGNIERQCKKCGEFYR